MYAPNNTSIYLNAFAGFMAGITAPATTDVNAGDYTLYGQMADAWAQEVDTVWGAIAPTSLELDEILTASESVWGNRSPLGALSGIIPGAYNQVAQAVIARVKQGNAQVVSEGIDPNGGGVPGGVTTVTGTAPITSTGGATPAIGITAATDVAAGSMSAADKTKLDGLPTGGVFGTPTSLPAGTTDNLSEAPVNNRWYNSTGAQNNAELPATPNNGDLVILKNVGANVAAPLLITARGGFTVELIGTGAGRGNFSAANGLTSFSDQGGTVCLQADTTNNRWGVLWIG